MFTFSVKKFTPSAALALMLAASSGVWANGGQFSGVVVGVTDGDTMTVLDTKMKSHTVRLAYIDSPETTCHMPKPSYQDDRCVDRGQDFAKAAKKSLSAMVYKKDVTVDVLPGSSYGREIGVVRTISRGVELNVNLAQIDAGMAWFYRHYAITQLSSSEFNKYGNAEQSARRSGRGLWSHANPVAPWDYRSNRSPENHASQGGVMESQAGAKSFFGRIVNAAMPSMKM